MTDIKKQFVDEFKNELKGKDGFSDGVIKDFEKYFNDKLKEEKCDNFYVLDSTLTNGQFIFSDIGECLVDVKNDINKNINLNQHLDNSYNTRLLGTYSGYCQNNLPINIHILNKNNNHYTADLINVNGEVIYNLDSISIGTQTDNNCCIHAFEQTLVLQDLVKFYFDNKIIEPDLNKFIKESILKLKKDGVFKTKEKQHFTNLRKEIYKIYVLNKFLNSNEENLKNNGNYDKIKNYRDTLYNNLLNKDSEVNFANYLDFNSYLKENKEKILNLEGIKRGNNSLLKEDKEQIKFLRFLNTTPNSLEEAKEYINSFGELDNINIDKLDNWKLKIFVIGASEYICRAIQYEKLLSENLDAVKKIYSIIKNKDEIKKKLGDKDFEIVEFGLNRALTYINELNNLVKVKNSDELTVENIKGAYKKTKEIKTGDNTYTFNKSKNVKNDIIKQLKDNNNANVNNFDFINIGTDLDNVIQLTEEEFQEILDNADFKKICGKVGKNANFLFYKKLKSLDIVSDNIGLNFGNFDFGDPDQQKTLFSENNTYCLVDAGNGNNITGGGVNGACNSLLNGKFNIKVQDKLKDIHNLNKNSIIDCGNNCKVQCISQDKENKVTLLKFYKEEGKTQKDKIFILYVTGPDLSKYESENVAVDLKELENTLNSLMDTISKMESTLSSKDTIIFGGISNSIFAGIYQHKTINGDVNGFNAIDLFNALVYKVKSKEKKPMCNVSFTWGVGKAIDFINELHKTKKDINIETDILDKFVGIDKNDGLYKYFKKYMESHFDKIFSTIPKNEIPKKEETPKKNEIPKRDGILKKEETPKKDGIPKKEEHSTGSGTPPLKKTIKNNTDTSTNNIQDTSVFTTNSNTNRDNTNQDHQDHQETTGKQFKNNREQQHQQSQTHTATTNDKLQTETTSNNKSQAHTTTSSDKSQQTHMATINDKSQTKTVSGDKPKTEMVSSDKPQTQKSDTKINMKQIQLVYAVMNYYLKQQKYISNTNQMDLINMFMMLTLINRGLMGNNKGVTV